MHYASTRLGTRPHELWPAIPLVALGVLLAGLQLRHGTLAGIGTASLLLAASLAAGLALVALQGMVWRIAASSLIAALAVLVGRPAGMDAIGAMGLFLAADAILILACVILDRAATQLAAADEMTALLLFEGEVASSNARDSRQELCRALLALSQRADRPFSILRLHWPIALVGEDDQGGSFEWQGRRVEQHLRRFRAITALARLVRSSDIVLAGADRGCAYVACPDTGPLGAGALGSRAARSIEQIVGAPVGFSSASYPIDGYHIEELMAAADRGGTPAAAEERSKVPARPPARPVVVRRPPPGRVESYNLPSMLTMTGESEVAGGRVAKR